MNRTLFAALVIAAAVRAQTAPTLGLQRFVIDGARSQVAFDGSSTVHDFTGKTSKVTGEFRFDPVALEATAGGAFRVDAASLDTDNKDRDVEMRQRLETDRFPEMVFTLDQLKGELNGLAGTVKARGRFGIHGVERERMFDVMFASVEGGVRVQGESKFLMTDHGIEPPVAFVITTSDAVRARFDLVLRPLAAAMIPARVYGLEVTETLAPSGGVAKTTERRERLWVAGDRMLWERPGQPDAVLCAGAATTRLNFRTARRSGPAEACDAAFVDSIARLEGLKKKLGDLTPERRTALGAKVSEMLLRLEAAAALAPAAGAAQVVTATGRTAVKLGGTEWGVLEQPQGTEPLGAILLAFDGLPAAVRSALTELKGLPATLQVRTVSPAGTRTLQVRFGAAIEGALPAWALDPGSWTVPGTEGISW